MLLVILNANAPDSGISRRRQFQCLAAQSHGAIILRDLARMLSATSTQTSTARMKSRGFMFDSTNSSVRFPGASLLQMAFPGEIISDGT